MKRRNDSDGINRTDRRETHCRKKVKFAGTDEEDDLSSEDPAFQGEETGAQNHKGNAASVPKTSEYAFFKKLMGARCQKSLPHSILEEDDRAERLSSTNRFHGNEDSSVAVNHNDVITAKFPTAYLSTSCVSGKPAKPMYGDLKFWRDKSKLKCSPEVVQQPMQPTSTEICRMYYQNIGLANVDQYNESGDEDYSKTSYKPGEVFSRKRKSLLSCVPRSSFHEIGELRSKGCELASVLLSRLTPKGTDTLPLSGLLKSRSVSYADAEESYQKSTLEFMDIEDEKYLMDNAFSSGLNKYIDGNVLSYKPQTAVAAASKHITYRGEADCITKTLDAEFSDGACDFSLNLATMEDGFIPLHGWNCENASQSSDGAEPKGDLSMSFADWVLDVRERRRFPSDACDDLEMLQEESRRFPSDACDDLEMLQEESRRFPSDACDDLETLQAESRRFPSDACDDLGTLQGVSRRFPSDACDDLEILPGESRRFPSDICDDLETLPRLPSWIFDYHWPHKNSALDEEENTFALSVRPAAFPRLYPSAMHAQDRDYMAKQPWMVLDGIPSHSSSVSNYSFQTEDYSLSDWVLDESYSGKRRQHCPKPVLQSFLISSSFDLRCLSPAGGLAIRNSTLTRSPYQVPLASIRYGESEALENGSDFMESPLCLYFNRSSLYFLSIADREETSPGLPGILN